MDFDESKGRRGHMIKDVNIATISTAEPFHSGNLEGAAVTCDRLMLLCSQLYATNPKGRTQLKDWSA